MRRFDEPIQVRHPLAGEAGADLAPVAEAMQFLWRGKLWRVQEVLAHWRETGAWWLNDAEDDDLLAEAMVWRVHARSGQYGRDGVYELAQRDDLWRLRAVVD